MDSPEFMESTTVRFEWTVRGLQELFESSKGETKSKVTKSARFGGGRWQILFYPNSGIVNADGQGFMSLYLACEPTAQEKESAVNGKWVRGGVYKFGFELHNLQKTIRFGSKEANDHSFSYKTVNWGWAQFARRDTVYYQSSLVRQADAILIICTITSSPVPPIPPSVIPQQLVPKDLLNAMGNLLDDPVYSDVEFILPRKRGSGFRSIYAAKKMLGRVDYFSTMFLSGFSEGITSKIPLADIGTSAESASIISDVDMPAIEDDELDSTFKAFHRFQDSDDEDDEDDDVTSTEEPMLELHLPVPDRADRAVEQSHLRQDSDPWDTVEGEHPTSASNSPRATGFQSLFKDLSHASRPGTPTSRTTRDSNTNVKDTNTVSSKRGDDSDFLPAGLPRVRVVVKDAAYSTYRAVLYYIYTDTIVFAPLASSFNKHSNSTSAPPQPTAKQLRPLNVSTPAAMAPESQANFQLSHASKFSLNIDTNMITPPKNRKEWIAEWQANNPNKPRPCSAKAAYRLADRLDLADLKERAFQHIIKSLTVDNVAYEVFSDFSAAFEDVRKVEVQFFLDHWADIRGSEAMRNVWQQIRVGRHPGFEEVWPLIATNLEFKPHNPETNAERDRTDGRF